MKEYIIQSGSGKEKILSPEEFIAISKANGWGKNQEYDMEEVFNALDLTFFIVAIRSKEKNQLLGCVRAFSDDMFFTTIPDIFVDPDQQGNGFGAILMEKIKERLGHTAIFFGAQPGKEGFYEKLGFQKGMQSYVGKFRKREN